MNKFQEIFDLLLNHYGPQGWWPAESCFEIIVGAVLTQNTKWANVDRALTNLRREGLLAYEKLSSVDEAEISQWIRPAGYHNLKARRLKNLLDMIEEFYEGNLSSMVEDDLESVRKNLLSVKGVGPETADSILLYALEKPVFVVDAYTYRIFVRHNLVFEEADYYQLQEEVVSSLASDVRLFNEYHALIVKVGQEFCKKRAPRCAGCPLEVMIER